MTPNPIPDVARLNLLLDYQPSTGKLFWKTREASSFSATACRTPEQLCNIWNGKSAGKPAFNCKRQDGYLVGSIDTIRLLAHRVVFKMLHGYDPAVIDHDDGDPSNNTPSNLIDGTQKTNMRNRRLSKNNSSGFNGVYFTPSRNMWEARIAVNNVSIFLGYFATKQEAITARSNAAHHQQYHPNHGTVR